MKHPKINYVLVPLVVLIWVLLLWQFMGFSEKESPNGMIVSEGVGVGAWERDSFTIRNNYPDPFLGQRHEEALLSYATTRAQPRSRGNALTVGSIIKKPSEIIFPDFHYQGGVQRDSTSDIMTGVLRMDNRVFSVQTGEKIGELEILFLEIDKIRLRYQDSVLLLKKEW